MSIVLRHVYSESFEEYEYREYHVFARISETKIQPLAVMIEREFEDGDKAIKLEFKKNGYLFFEEIFGEDVIDSISHYAFTYMKNDRYYIWFENNENFLNWFSKLYPNCGLPQNDTELENQ
jgi:hypothetical protein